MSLLILADMIKARATVVVVLVQILTLVPVAARFHPWHPKLDPSGFICDVVSIGLQLGSCLATLIVASTGNAQPARQTDNTLSRGSNVSNWGSADTSTSDATPARNTKADDYSGPDLSLIAEHDEDLLLRDLVVKASAPDGRGRLPMERWLSAETRPPFRLA